MHIHNLDQWQHDHHFYQGNMSGERNTRLVILLTVFMMVIEIAAGYYFGSMALLADGWHMGSHATALGITMFAYIFARSHAHDPKYSFGTGKVGVLGGFASAIALAVVALLMAGESITRLLNPVSIQFNEAIMVAVIGLVVNLLSAFLLKDHHHHGHDYGHHHHESDHHEHHHHGDHHDNHGHHEDHNLKAAYLHVMADALTSLLAIVALIAGKFFGWIWMDALMGIVGSIVIMRWSLSLLRDTSTILLDSDVDPLKIKNIRTLIEDDADNKIVDLHIWRINSSMMSLIVSLVTHFPKPPEHYKALLASHTDLVHISIEVNEAHSDPCLTNSTGEVLNAA